ncbi:MAG: hypothetical protein JWR69_4453 [Pedosphaera sp.]|nr:hypothetical protein [Pedosphaera sp.]
MKAERQKKAPIPAWEWVAYVVIIISIVTFLGWVGRPPHCGISKSEMDSIRKHR